MSKPEVSKKHDKATVYYDGSCALCSLEIGHYKRIDHDGEINFVDVSGADQIAADLDRVDAMARFHVRAADGTLHSGARGFVVLWEKLPVWRLLVPFARHRFVLPVLERGYVAFLKVRPKLSRLVGKIQSRRAARGRRSSG